VDRYCCRKVLVSSLARAMMVSRLMIVCNASALFIGGALVGAGRDDSAGCGASCCQGKGLMPDASSLSEKEGSVAVWRSPGRLLARGARGSGYGRVRPRRLREVVFA